MCFTIRSHYPLVTIGSVAYRKVRKWHMANLCAADRLDYVLRLNFVDDPSEMSTGPSFPLACSEVLIKDRCFNKAASLA